MALSTTIVSSLNDGHTFSMAMFANWFNCSCGPTFSYESHSTELTIGWAQAVLAAATGPGTLLHTAATATLALALACVLAVTVSDDPTSLTGSAWRVYVRQVLGDICTQQLLVALVVQSSVLWTACTMTRQDVSMVWPTNIATTIMQLLALSTAREGTNDNIANGKMPALMTSCMAMTAVFLSTLDASDPGRALGCSPFFPQTLDKAIGGMRGLAVIAVLTIMRLFVVHTSQSRESKQLCKNEQLAVVFVSFGVAVVTAKQLLGGIPALADVYALESVYLRESNTSIHQLLKHGPERNASHFLPLILLSLPLYSLGKAFFRAVHDVKIDQVFDVEARAGLVESQREKSNIRPPRPNRRDISPSATGILLDPYQPKRRSWGI